MNFAACYQFSPHLLMEGALGTRLTGEYGLCFDPQVAMAALLYQPRARQALEALWSGYYRIASSCGLPFLAATPTRRANQERVKGSAYGQRALIRDNVAFLQYLRRKWQAEPLAAASPLRAAASCRAAVPMYIGGLMGCRGDAYRASQVLRSAAARAFHAWAADQFQDAGADFLYAGIMPALPEALGMAQALADTGLPYIISFTLGPEGCLADGTLLARAIETIDARTTRPPLCYMSNCVHPDILRQALLRPENTGSAVRERFCGIQANASPLPPGELERLKEPLTSDPESWAAKLTGLASFMNLKIAGGCCGTKEAHLAALARRLLQLQP